MVYFLINDKQYEYAGARRTGISAVGVAGWASASSSFASLVFSNYLDGFDAESETATGALLFAKRHVAQFGDGFQFVLLRRRSRGIDCHHLPRQRSEFGQGLVIPDHRVVTKRESRIP